MSSRATLLCTRLIRRGGFRSLRGCTFNGGGCRGPLARSFHAVPFARSERAQVYLEKERKPGSPRTQSRAARAHMRARITRFTTPSHPSSPPPPLSLSHYPFLSHSWPSSWRPFPFLLSSSSRPAFSFRLPPVLEAESWSCYNPESADGRPMYGSLFYAACIALRCTPRKRARLSPLLYFGRNAHAISTASAPRLLLMHGPRTCNTGTEQVASRSPSIVKYSIRK